MKKLINKIYQFIFPFVSVWLVIFYFRILINYHDIISNWLWSFFFIPVIFFESLSSSLFLQEKPIRLWSKEYKNRILLLGRIIFWYGLFLVWAVFLPNSIYMDKSLIVEVFSSQILKLLLHVYIAESYITLLAFILWVALYYFITVKKRKFRIFTSLILPVGISGIMYYHFYYFGGVGECSPSRVSSQKGVEIFYSKEDFPKINYSEEQDWIKINSPFPRDIYIDTEQNVLYANYGNTFDKSAQSKAQAKKIPNILRIDLETKETKYFSGNFIRAMSAHTSTIFVSPLFERKIYELSKKDLSVIRTFPVQVDMEYWEIMDIYHDPKRDYIYVANEINVAFLKYDYKTGKLIDHIYPEGTRFAGGMWSMVLSEKTGMIYIITYFADQDIIEVDPETLDVNRTLDVNNYGVFAGVSSLELDDEKGLLYLQNGGSNKLYEIDLENFKIRRVFKGEVHARRMLIDKKRNVMYINSFYYGKLVALDLEIGKRVWTVRVGGKPYGLALNNDILYVNSRAGIVKIDLEAVWREYSE